MNKLKKQIQAFIPEILPQTSADVVQYCREVLLLAGQDPENKNLVHSVAAALMRSAGSSPRASKRHFVQFVQSALTNAAAFEVIEAIRNEEKAKQQS